MALEISRKRSGSLKNKPSVNSSVFPMSTNNSAQFFVPQGQGYEDELTIGRMVHVCNQKVE
jgi:hypothetical protein